MLTTVREELLLFPVQQADRGDDHGEGQRHAGGAEGIAGGDKARARTCQGDHVAHPALDAKYKNRFDKKKEKGKGTMVFICETEASGILTFYMGKNTPERKDYIMERLVVPVEE
jgi:hypothetical protein